MATTEIDIIKKHSKELSPTQKLELIEFLTKSLRERSQNRTQIEYGKYSSSSRRKSTAKDFQIAEWHPTDLDLNGN